MNDVALPEKSGIRYDPATRKTTYDSGWYALIGCRDCEDDEYGCDLIIEGPFASEEKAREWGEAEAFDCPPWYSWVERKGAP